MNGKCTLFLATVLTSAALTVPASAQFGLFRNRKETPELVFDFTGSSPAVFLGKRDGLGKWRYQHITDGEVRLVPNSAVELVIYSGLKNGTATASALQSVPAFQGDHSLDGAPRVAGGTNVQLPLIRVTKNKVSSEDVKASSARETSEAPVENDEPPATPATPAGTPPAPADNPSPAAPSVPQGNGMAAPNMSTATASPGLLTTSFFVNVPPAVSTAAGIDTLHSEDNPETRHTVKNNVVRVREPGAINVLPDGSMVVEVTGVLPNNTFSTASVSVLAAEKWSFQNAFSPYMEVDHGTSFNFAATNTLYSLGANENLRIDSVAVFNPDDNTSEDGSFLGIGLSYSTFIGSQFKSSGRRVFGFPLRLTFTAGLVGLSFSEHAKGSGEPFVGVGIAIPIGG